MLRPGGYLGVCVHPPAKLCKEARLRGVLLENPTDTAEEQIRLNEKGLIFVNVKTVGRI
jgi:hypothetical protein